MIARLLGASSIGRLLHEAGDRHDLVAVEHRVRARLDRDGAVLVDVLPADVEQGDHRAAVLGLHGEHVLEQVVALVDQVVAEQDGERLVADERRRLEDGVAEPLGLALPHEVHLRHVGGGVHRRQPVGVALLLQRGLELGVPVEEVLDGGLVAAGDHEHLGQAGARGLLDDVLQRRAVDDGQQFLRHRLRRGQEARAHPRDGDDGLPGRTGQPVGRWGWTWRQPS